jgi:hypothetical protein
MDAPVLYMVRGSVDPQRAAEHFAWLDGGHCAEVISQPGFRFVRRVTLEQKDSDGWEKFMVIYGVESREALEAYFNDTATRKKFAREGAAFELSVRTDRVWGSVEFSLDASPIRDRAPQPLAKS